ncbi:MAG: hypothetical protein JNL11_13420 [Bdellovibrionaceae bacterium]|nr:hypothetical protein [Pseudobdellovibrionaceae bacterium]
MEQPESTNQKVAFAIQKNNQHLAHDLRSPISALNIVASLSAEQLPEGSRELLNMALTRLQEIANKLESKN